jgi:hypothetical protein
MVSLNFIIDIGIKIKIKMAPEFKMAAKIISLSQNYKSKFAPVKNSLHLLENFG